MRLTKFWADTILGRKTDRISRVKAMAAQAFIRTNCADRSLFLIQQIPEDSLLDPLVSRSTHWINLRRPKDPRQRLMVAMKMTSKKLI